MNVSLHHARRGISLLEVLISIGILAIGLTSVISLVPAGKSEAGRAVMLDRASLLAANVLSDAITFGYTRPHSFVTSGTSLVVFDAVPGPWPAASLETMGVFGTTASTATVPVQVTNLVTQGRDDLIYDLPTTADDPPLNKFIEGTRAFQGRTSSLIALAGLAGTTPLAAGDLAKLTVVVFHNRDMSSPFVTGTYAASGVLSFTPPAGRRMKEIVRPGTVIFDPSKLTTVPYNALSQVVMASIDDVTNPATPVAYVTFSGVSPNAGVVQILADSVGMAERMVTLEGPGPYSQ